MRGTMLPLLCGAELSLKPLLNALNTCVAAVTCHTRTGYGVFGSSLGLRRGRHIVAIIASLVSVS